LDQKKVAQLPPFVCHAARPGPRRSYVHDPGTGWTLVVCARKSQRLLGVDCPLSKEPASSARYVSSLQVAAW